MSGDSGDQDRSSTDTRSRAPEERANRQASEPDGRQPPDPNAHEEKREQYTEHGESSQYYDRRQPEKPSQPNEQYPDQHSQSERYSQPNQQYPQSHDQYSDQPVSNRPHRGEPEPLSGGGEHTRRQLLKSGAALGLLGILGYLVLESRSGETAAGGATLDDVPNGMDFVVHGTGGSLLDTTAFQTVVDEELQARGFGNPTTLSDLLDSIEYRTGIDPRETGEMTAFGAATEGSGTYAAVRFDSNVPPAAVAERLEETGVLRDVTEYNGRELWHVGHRNFLWDMVFCSLGPREYALGTTEEIRDIIDLQEGEGNRVTGDVTRAFDAARPGVLHGGFVVPPELLRSVEIPIIGEQFGENIEYGYGTVSEEADGELELTLEASSSSAAEDIGQTLNALQLVDTEIIDDVVDLDPEITALVLAILDDITVETAGSEVDVVVADGFRVAALAVIYLLTESQSTE